MSLFGFGDVEIIAIAALLILFFGRNKVMEWYKDIANARHAWAVDKAKIDAEIKAEATKASATQEGASKA
jgi:Sec-independent protein translocase protein TatA